MVRMMKSDGTAESTLAGAGTWFASGDPNPGDHASTTQLCAGVDIGVVMMWRIPR
jgi:hypothetical protein